MKDYSELESYLKNGPRQAFYSAIPSNLETRNQAGHTIMHLAAQYGDLVALTHIFSHHPGLIFAQDNHGMCPIDWVEADHLGEQNANLEQTKELLEHFKEDAQINYTDLNALLFCTAKDAPSPQLEATFATIIGDLWTMEPETRSNALHFAVICNHNTFISYLHRNHPVKFASLCKQKTKKGETPIKLAIKIDTKKRLNQLSQALEKQFPGSISEENLMLLAQESHTPALHIAVSSQSSTSDRATRLINHLRGEFIAKFVAQNDSRPLGACAAAPYVPRPPLAPANSASEAKSDEAPAARGQENQRPTSPPPTPRIGSVRHNPDDDHRTGIIRQRPAGADVDLRLHTRRRFGSPRPAAAAASVSSDALANAPTASPIQSKN